MPPIQPTARLCLAFGIALAIWLSLMPGEDLPGGEAWDKLLHFAAYAVLATAGAIGFQGRRAALAVAVGLLLLGALLEIVQASIPGRQASVLDGLANAGGIAAGLAAVWTGTRVRRLFAPGAR